MLTVIYKKPDGSEEIRGGFERVIHKFENGTPYLVGERDNDPVAVMFGGSGIEKPANYAYEHCAYVMNNAGATVAKYVL